MGKFDKFVKLFTRKTGRGKANILIDILFHGFGTLGYIFDELFHITVEGFSFSMRKFVKFGNAARIFGKGFSRLVRFILKLKP